jgi:hypothetical protein
MEGRKAFAIHTNDSVRDDFPQHHLAKVLAKNGNYIIYAYSEDARDSNINILILRILDNDPKAWYNKSVTSINVEVLHRDVNVTKIMRLPFLKSALIHINIVIKNPYSDCVTPKYCLNPGRIVELRLFQKDMEGELVSFNDEGKKLMVSRKSYERHTSIVQDGDILDNNFIRCFYSRKHKDEEIIYVDGYTLPMLDRHELSDYIEQSKDHPNFNEWTIVKAITTYGNEFFAIQKFDTNDLRPIYKLSSGYATFHLNEYERSFIATIEVVQNNRAS